MMKYNFDEPVNRRGTDSVKWDLDKEGVLPMWVADMDFKTAPAVTAALVKRAEHGVFGYTHPSASYYTALSGWFKRRHNWSILQGWVLYTTGVVPALSAVIKAFCRPGEKVLVQTPVYNCFFSSIKNNGCETVSSPLVYDSGSYRMDFTDFEQKAADPAVKLFLLCNPHNPAGRVWTEAELRRIGEICLKRDILVVADEIHCELTAPGIAYTPFASLSPDFLNRSVTCISPSKAFNLAGLQTANIVAADKDLRAQIDRALNINEVCSIGPFGAEALIAAYNEGGEWLDELNVYLHENFSFLCEFCARNLPQLRVTPLEGTYLAWVNCKALGRTSEELAKELLQKGRVRVNAGSLYGAEGEGFIRLNLACPRAQLAEALNRMKTVFDALL